MDAEAVLSRGCRSQPPGGARQQRPGYGVPIDNPEGGGLALAQPPQARIQSEPHMTASRGVEDPCNVVAARTPTSCARPNRSQTPSGVTTVTARAADGRLEPKGAVVG